MNVLFNDISIILDTTVMIFIYFLSQSFCKMISVFFATTGGFGCSIRREGVELLLRKLIDGGLLSSQSRLLVCFSCVSPAARV